VKENAKYNYGNSRAKDNSPFQEVQIPDYSPDPHMVTLEFDGSQRGDKSSGLSKKKDVENILENLNEMTTSSNQININSALPLYGQDNAVESTNNLNTDSFEESPYLLNQQKNQV
tara:strand:+ start:168 stop:512 length:345 start_codon:yes stop_codon:yes gene_type:complete